MEVLDVTPFAVFLLWGMVGAVIVALSANPKQRAFEWVAVSLILVFPFLF